MNCKCIEKLNIELKSAYDPEEPELEIAFSGSGKVYPYLSATYEKKSGRGYRTKHIILIPTFCPFCGKRYERKP